MAEVLKAFCKDCNHSWLPYGRTPFEIPHVATIDCPNCAKSQRIEWFDSETQKKAIQRKLGLDSDPKLESKITQLENELSALREGRDADRKEIQNLRQLIDLSLSKDITLLKEQYSQHEYDKNFLQGQITKLEETLEEIKRISLQNQKDLNDGR